VTSTDIFIIKNK